MLITSVLIRHLDISVTRPGFVENQASDSAYTFLIYFRFCLLLAVVLWMITKPSDCRERVRTLAELVFVALFTELWILYSLITIIVQ